MQLGDFYDYKNRLMEDLLTNEAIVQLINEHMTLDEAEKLAYTQVFPYEFIPETTQEGFTYVMFDVDVQKSSNKTYLLPTLYVWVMAHKSRLRLPDGKGVRTDALCNEICKAINGSRYYGLGELDIYSVKRFAPMSDYNGKCLTFYATEFNRPYSRTAPKQTPANRKAGE